MLMQSTCHSMHAQKNTINNHHAWAPFAFEFVNPVTSVEKGGWDHWYARLHLLHIILNSMQSLHDLSHLEISYISEALVSNINNFVCSPLNIEVELMYNCIIIDISNRDVHVLTRSWRWQCWPTIMLIIRGLVVEPSEHWLGTLIFCLHDVTHSNSSSCCRYRGASHWVLWKIDTSTPANLKVSFNHLTVVQEATGLWGFLIATNSLLVSFDQRGVVDLSHCCKVSTEHKDSVLSGKDRKNSLKIFPYEGFFAKQLKEMLLPVVKSN